MEPCPEPAAIAIQWADLLLDLGYSRTQIAAALDVSAPSLSYWTTGKRPIPEERLLALIDHGSQEFVRIANEAFDGDEEARARIVQAMPRLRDMKQQSDALYLNVFQMIKAHCHELGNLADTLRPKTEILHQNLSSLKQPATELVELIHDLQITISLGETFTAILKDAERWEQKDWYAKAGCKRQAVR